MADELYYMTIAEAGARIARKDLSPVELIDAYINRIEALNRQLDAFVTPTLDLARQQAKAAEADIVAGRHKGVLHGIPFGLKDIY